MIKENDLKRMEKLTDEVSKNQNYYAQVEANLLEYMLKSGISKLELPDGNTVYLSSEE